MSELTDLYQQVILDHNKSPRNWGELSEPRRRVEGYNPLCGDRLTLYVRLDDDVITDIAFEGSGCAISKASASIMTDAVKNRTRAEADALFEKVHSMLTGGTDVDPLDLGKLAVFSGVSEFPARVKCASLAWHTLRATFQENTDTVTTE